MAINKGQFFTNNDVFIDYPFEEVMYRWNHTEQKIYVRFYGEEEKPDPISHDNRLLNDPILSGDEISREKYEQRWKSNE